MRFWWPGHVYLSLVSWIFIGTLLGIGLLFSFIRSGHPAGWLLGVVLILVLVTVIQDVRRRVREPEK